MAQPDLGDAVIVYEDPDEGTVERTVQNERIAHFQDHWIIKLDEDEAGNDIVRRIPRERVHYVERSVEKFEDEVGTLRNQVESIANDLQSTLLGSDDDDDRTEQTPIEINTESDDNSGSN